MHATRAFLFDHFAAEPWPRKAEVIVEPAHRCLRCPSPIMDCVLEHDFDVCWEADGTSHAPDSSSLEPLPRSALDALVEMQSTLTDLGLADVCWKDVPALGCHPANVSSSEFGAAVGAPAKSVWVPWSSRPLAHVEPPNQLWRRGRHAHRAQVQLLPHRRDRSRPRGRLPVQVQPRRARARELLPRRDEANPGACRRAPSSTRPAPAHQTRCSSIHRRRTPSSCSRGSRSRSR